MECFGFTPSWIAVVGTALVDFFVLPALTFWLLSCLDEDQSPWRKNLFVFCCAAGSSELIGMVIYHADPDVLSTTSKDEVPQSIGRAACFLAGYLMKAGTDMIWKRRSHSRDAKVNSTSFYIRS